MLGTEALPERDVTPLLEFPIHPGDLLWPQSLIARCHVVGVRGSATPPGNQEPQHIPQGRGVYDHARAAPNGM